MLTKDRDHPAASIVCDCPATEFAELITTQRGFQANARIITTSDEVLEEVVNLKR